MSRSLRASTRAQQLLGTTRRAQLQQTDLSQASSVHKLMSHAGNQAVSGLLGPGQALPPALRSDMESRFGNDFGDVRVHNDAAAHRHAAALGAEAYTERNHVVFDAGSYAPDTAEGRHLLAHELAHVVQQRRGGHLQPRSDGQGPLEADASQAAQAVVQGAPAQVAQGSAPGVAASTWRDRFERLKDVAGNPMQALGSVKQELSDKANAWASADKPTWNERIESLDKAAGSPMQTLGTAKKHLSDKASAWASSANDELHKAAHDFDADAANRLSDAIAPMPIKAIEQMDSWAEKAKDSPTWSRPANNLRNAFKPLAAAFRDANRDVLRETFVGKGFQAGADSGINRVDEAIQGLFRRAEQKDFRSEKPPDSSKTDTPLADAWRHYADDPFRAMREAQVGVYQALWKIVPGMGRMLTHPVATVRGLGELPVVVPVPPLMAVRAAGVATGFLWDSLSGSQPVGAAAINAIDKLRPSPSKEWDKSVNLFKALTHDWTKAYNEGRPVAATTHAATDILMFALPFLQAGKAGTVADVANALGKVEEGVNVTNKLATTGETLGDVAKVSDVAQDARTLQSATDAKALAESAQDVSQLAKPGPLRGVPQGFFDDAIAKLDELTEPFQSGFGEKTKQKLLQGHDGAGSRAMRPHIDEPLPVGDANIKTQRAVDRATDAQNRQFLDPATNSQNKHLGISADDIERGRHPLEPVSLLDPKVDPAVVFQRRFGEVTELRQAFDEALAKIQDVRKYKPTQLKAKINRNLIEIIRDGQTPSGAAVRDALKSLGFEYQPGKGLGAVKEPVAPPVVTSAATTDAAAGPRIVLDPPSLRIRVDTTQSPSAAVAEAEAIHAQQIAEALDDAQAMLEAAQQQALKKRFLGP